MKFPEQSQNVMIWFGLVIKIDPFIEFRRFTILSCVSIHVSESQPVVFNMSLSVRTCLPLALCEAVCSKTLEASDVKTLEGSITTPIKKTFKKNMIHSSVPTGRHTGGLEKPVFLVGYGIKS